MPAWAAKVAAIAVSFVVNFSLSHFVVFRARPRGRRRLKAPLSGHEIGSASVGCLVPAATAGQRSRMRRRPSIAAAPGTTSEAITQIPAEAG